MSKLDQLEQKARDTIAWEEKVGKPCHVRVKPPTLLALCAVIREMRDDLLLFHHIHNENGWSGSMLPPGEILAKHGLEVE